MSHLKPGSETHFRGTARLEIAGDPLQPVQAGPRGSAVIDTGGVMSEHHGPDGVVRTDGAILRYACEGAGRPALVIGSAVYYPRTFSRELRRHLRLAFVDARHFAAEDGARAPGEISLGTYMSDIERVHDRLGHGRVVLIGHSHHGNLALEYARRHPHRVTHVVMIGSPPVDVDSTVSAAKAYWDQHASAERKALLQARLAALRASATEQMTPQEAFVAQYVAEGPKYWRDPAYDAAPLWQGVPINMRALAAFRAFFADGYALRWDPEHLAAPVLVMTGRYDYAVPPTLWDDPPATPASLTIRLFERSGHTPQLEEPAAFDRTLLEWLATAAGR